MRSKLRLLLILLLVGCLVALLIYWDTNIKKWRQDGQDIGFALYRHLRDGDRGEPHLSFQAREALAQADRNFGVVKAFSIESSVVQVTGPPVHVKLRVTRDSGTTIENATVFGGMVVEIRIQRAVPSR